MRSMSDTDELREVLDEVRCDKGLLDGSGFADRDYGGCSWVGGYG